MTNQYFLDFYDNADKKVAEVDITYKTNDEIEHLVEVEKQYYGRYAQVRSIPCARTAQLGN
jgi:hypothetical protein